MSGNPLTLIVHDYDVVAARQRSEELRRATLSENVHTFSRRGELLAAISKLPLRRNDECWPLALIDLQGENDLEARGEHLLGTINEHPDLCGRVALIAFTRYGFGSRDEVLRALGARAVLSPIDLCRQEGLLDDLELLASGSEEFVHIGEPPAQDIDKEVIRQLASYFPELEDESLDERKRWERARWILHICRLEREGHDRRAIVAQVPGLSRRGFTNLRDELLKTPAAGASGVISPASRTPSLGKVIDALQLYLRETPLIWDVTTERTQLDGEGRLNWIRDRVAARYAAHEEPESGSDDAWIPPEYLQALRRFLIVHAELPTQKRRSNPASKAVSGRVLAALEIVAKEMAIAPEQAHHYVAHAVMCLEDAEADGVSGN